MKNVKLKAIYCILYEYDQLIYNIKHKTSTVSSLILSYYLVQIVFIYKVWYNQNNCVILFSI